MDKTRVYRGKNEHYNEFIPRKEIMTTLEFANKFRDTQERKEVPNTVFDCIKDTHIRQYHAGKGMREVLRGLQRRNLSQMRLGATVLHEVYRETNQN